jgi:hypothetical protein
MKKLLLLALLIYGSSCSNPEDKATGNPDSIPYNKTGNETNLNTPAPELGNQSEISKNDTSSMPSTSAGNANSTTQGTNRSYSAGGDSSKQK